MVWYQNDIPHPQLPPATTYEWKEEEDKLMQVPTRDPPAPHQMLVQEDQL